MGGSVQCCVEYDIILNCIITALDYIISYVQYWSYNDLIVIIIWMRIIYLNWLYDISITPGIFINTHAFKTYVKEK